jgi:hypothetical protein
MEGFKQLPLVNFCFINFLYFDGVIKFVAKYDQLRNLNLCPPFWALESALSPSLDLGLYSFGVKGRFQLKYKFAFKGGKICIDFYKIKSVVEVFIFHARAKSDLLYTNP